MANITLITAIFGLAFGLVGAVLGVINTWRSFARDKVRVRVVPVALLFDNGNKGFGIEVTNLSWFPVTISGVGFTVRGKGGYDRLAWLPSNIQGCKLPERMEARTSFTARLPMASHEWDGVHLAYAQTACGLRFTGTSPALKQMLAHT